MQPTRSSKRVAGFGADEELPTKRPNRPLAPSRKVQDALQPPTGKRPRKKASQNLQAPPSSRSPTPYPVPLPQDQVPGVIREAPRSSPSPNSTPPTNPPKGRTCIEFDPTREQIAHPQMVSILLE